MRRWALVASLAIGGLIAFKSASERLSQDACLDSGGAWFGVIGCQKRLPVVDHLLVDKSERKLFAFEKGKLVRTMSVSLGRNPVGPKTREGDSKTPEGTYPIVSHKPDSSFHRALRIGYPTPEQVKLAGNSGTSLGSDIMFHGIRNGLGWVGTIQLRSDWTQGCIALTNGEIDWLYQSVADGTLVEIRA